MTSEESVIKQNKLLVCWAINALGPFIKINDNEKPNKVTYAIAAGHLRDLIRDVSSELTDEQKNCIYCHIPFEFIGNSDAGFRIRNDDRTISYYDAIGESFDNGSEFDVQFKFCPMCGRKLNVK